MRNLVICLLSLTLSGLYVMPSYGASPWPMFMHDARHSGRSAYVIPDNISIQWFSDFAVQEITGMSVSPDGNTIYAGSKDHNVYAVDASDGSVIWEFTADHEIVGTPAVDEDGNIYFGSKDDYLYCLNPDGTLKWNYNLFSDAIGSPVIGPLNVVVISVADRLYAVLNGISLWQDPVDLGPGRPYTSWYAGSAIGSDGTVYHPGSANDGHSALHAINPNGSSQWFIEIDATGTSEVTVGDDGTIYVPGGHGTGSNALSAVNADGTLKWSYPLQDSPYLSNPATGPDGTIYIGSNDSFLYAINPDGTLKWRYLMNSDMNGSSFAVDANGNVLTVSQNANAPLVALDSDGNLKWQVFPRYEFVSQAPVIGKNGAVYISNVEGIVAVSAGNQTEIRVGQSSGNDGDNGGGGENGGSGGGGGCFIGTLLP